VPKAAARFCCFFLLGRSWCWSLEAEVYRPTHAFVSSGMVRSQPAQRRAPWSKRLSAKRVSEGGYEHSRGIVASDRGCPLFLLRGRGGGARGVHAHTHALRARAHAPRRRRRRRVFCSFNGLASTKTKARGPPVGAHTVAAGDRRQEAAAGAPCAGGRRADGAW
jgi:hypothetical protein